MKKIVITIAILIMCKCLLAQLININPDPNGPPHFIGGVPPLTPEAVERKNNVPDAVINSNASNITLPEEVFNEYYIWFPNEELYYQEVGNCAQIAAVHYGFTYEINRVRNLDSDLEQNQYCVNFTWNMLNGGNGGGSWVNDGLSIIENNGIPTRDVWFIEETNFDDWMDGYSNYFDGMHNRIESFSKVDISTVAGYELLKQWLDNHNTGDENESGGIAPFECIILSNSTGELPYGNHEGEAYIEEIGTSGNPNHAMTIVGYSENIFIDVNGNGVYVNEDNNGNGIIELSEYEIGGVYIFNSWGDFGDLHPVFNKYGWAWIPCSVLGTAITIEAFLINAYDEYEPEYTARIKLNHNRRSEPKIGIIAYEDRYALPPESVSLTHEYEPFSIGLGGAIDLLGFQNTDPLNLEFDITPMLEENNINDPHVFYLAYKNKVLSYGSGTILDFSIVDRSGPEPFEFYCHESNVPIVEDDSKSITLDYNVLPATIPFQNEDIDYNCIVRNTTTIESSNFDFTGKYLDFYDNGHLIIKPNSNVGFTAPSGMKFFAMRKTGILELKGPANINPFSSFNTFQVNRSEEHYFKLLLNTQSEDYNFSGNVFRNTRLEGFSNSIVLNSCIFENCDIDYSWGDFYVQETGGGNSNFTNSCIKISRPFNASKTVNITNSSFDGSGIYDDLLYIEEYDNFTLNSNNFKNASGNGIYLFDAGHGLKHYIGNNELISDCGEQVPLSAGICMYNSIADIINNDEISGSPIGIKMYRYSDATIIGNQSAGSASETQQIADNDINQIYITPGSDPWYCHWNAIMDDDNTSPLYYIAPSPDWDGSGIDATNNYWGNYFNPSEDLSPGINYVPIWNLAFMEEHLNETQQMYNSAWEMEEDSNYTEAQNTLKLLVSTYPDSNLAITSMKDIFALEDEAGADYDSLKYYFENESAIQSDTILQKLAEFLVSMCDLKIENYQAAIDTYDSIIQNPSSEQDSIFAIIDLAYTYQLQEDSGSRNIYIGSFPQYKYANYKDFSKSRKYHLSLLHKDSPYMEPRNPQKIIGNDQFICYPNPSQGNIRISFKGDSDKRYSVKIFNGLGELVWEDILQGQTENIRTYNLKHFPRGMYVIQLREGNREVSSKKIFRM